MPLRKLLQSTVPAARTFCANVLRTFIGITVLLSGSLPAEATAPRLDAALGAAMKGTSSPAVGVLVIDNGKIVDTAVRGVRRLGSPEEVQATDKWHIGSNGKAFTATLIGRLVEQTRLSWSAPLQELLPTLAAEMRPEYRDVTLLDLLSHRSGLGDLTATDELFLSFYKDRRPLPRQRAALAAAMLSRPPVAPRQGEPKYSNAGFIVAAVVAESATGVRFETLMQEQVFDVLELKTATFDPPEPSDLAGHVGGHPADRTDANPPVYNPAGNFRISLADWARFCLDQMRGETGGGKLLSPATYRLLHRSQGDTEEALGWAVAGEFAGRKGPVIQHTGSDGNWYSAVALFPHSGDGVLVVANAGESMGGDRAVMQIAMPILATLSEPSH